MKTAQVNCIGLPTLSDELPWIFHKIDSDNKNGLVEFLAPANRRLKIEVVDWYGRDLKRPYTSSHEPGTKAIKQEFVVIP